MIRWRTLGHAYWLPLLLVVALGGCQPTVDDGVGTAAPEGVLSGTVFYRERIALPPDAVIEVVLEDVSLADAPAEVLAEQRIAADGRQVPIPFELRYAAGDVQANHRYGVRARIHDADGRLMFTTMTHYAAFEDGRRDDTVEILVERVGADPGPADTAAEPLPDGTWRLVAYRYAQGSEETVAPDQPYTLEFNDEGRVFGQAHCNRYTGGYARPEAGHLSISGIAATLMACPPPSFADEFLRMLGATERYVLDGDTLRLTFDPEGALIFTREAPDAAMAPEAGRTFVFVCAGDLHFKIRTGPGEVALWMPETLGGEYLVLGQTPAASGARYQEGDTVFWNRGNLATVEADGQRYEDCVLDPSLSDAL